MVPSGWHGGPQLRKGLGLPDLSLVLKESRVWESRDNRTSKGETAPHIKHALSGYDVLVSAVDLGVHALVHSINTS